MSPNPKVALLMLGLLFGAVVGYLTRPEAAEIKLGGTTIEFQNNQVSAGPSDGITGGQSRHILLYTLAGGIIGLLAGFAADRRR